MEKDFNTWNNRKISINNKEFIPFFHDREIWWCSVGVNVGDEIDGKNQYFERPVLIVRVFSREVFWGIPLTSKDRSGKYYFPIKLLDRPSVALLTQLRLFSGRRLLRKMSKISSEQYKYLKNSIIKLFE
jgi:mRNA interferase MazF